MRVGIRRRMFRIPSPLWRRAVGRTARSMSERERVLTGDDRRVRNYATGEVARQARPLTVDAIAAGVGLSADRARGIVEGLERAKTFLFRDGNGDVEWVYPFTAARTPHRLRFSTGEEVSAA